MQRMEINAFMKVQANVQVVYEVVGLAPPVPEVRRAHSQLWGRSDLQVSSSPVPSSADFDT